jgi:hypothetical protein
MKTLSKRLKSKTTAVAVTLVLLFAIFASLVAVSTVRAQEWSIYIAGTLSSGLIRCEVRLDNVRQQVPFSGIMLGVMAPGDTDWTYLGPFSTTNGRYDYTYSFNKTGTHQFQYMVPAQDPLPTNPATPDGEWYSNIVELAAGASIYIEPTTSTGRIRGEVRINGIRSMTAFTGITLGIKTPGATAWTYLGPFSTTNGRWDYYYNFPAGVGQYQMQYIVPPQGVLPTNPNSTDGKWYSDIVQPIYGWGVYILGTLSSWQIRGEVRFNDTLQSAAFTGITLGIKTPGATAWTYLGPFSTTNGRYDYYYDFAVMDLGDYAFQYIVPPQGVLPTNPNSTDGKWYSSIVTLTFVPPYRATTFAYINSVPNPVGIGQEVLIHTGITQQLSSVGQGWDNLTVSILRPDNITEIRGPYRSDSTGGTGTILVPDIPGNYTLQTHFPAQVIHNSKRTAAYGDIGYNWPIGTIMNESYSPKITLVVTEEPIPYYPDTPLPTEYWTRRIDDQLRDWNVIAGSSWEPEYQDAPESAHVLWAKRLGIESTLGGTTDINQPWSSDEIIDSTRFIISGILLYRQDPKPDVAQYWQNVSTIAMDVRTGQELWRLPNVAFSFGQHFYWKSYNRQGVYTYAWRIVNVGNASIAPLTQTYMAYDPFTSYWVYNYTRFPAGTRSFYPRDNAILVYNISLSGGYMTVWNSSMRVSVAGSWDTSGSYDCVGTSAAITRAYTNLTIPRGLTGNVVKVLWDDRVIGVDITDTTTREWAFSLDPAKNGTLLYDYKVNYAAPSVNPATTAGPLYVEGPIEDHVQLRYQAATRKYWAYSLKTGALLWSSENFDETKDGEHFLNHYSRDTKTAYGMLYTTGRSGITYAYNFTTGLVWTHAAWGTNPEIDWNTDWWSGIALISDGKVYVSNGEPANVESVPQGAPFICLNATTGEEIWRANGMFRQSMWAGTTIIGDSVIVTPDSYDQRVYAIGKGPSATTVSATDISVPYNSSVVVKGTVMDVSPGTTDNVTKLRFPNGVPAVSDESMSEWMKYVYKNLPRPADVKGVEVVISVFDSNNNYYPVGTTTSDASGTFIFNFVPPNPGKYQVYAQFDGSNSYYGSSAESALFVEEAPIATPAPSPTPVPMSEAYFVPAITGMIVGFVVVGVLLALLLLRKH